MILNRVARNEEPLGDRASVESGDERRNDVALALRECIGTAEDIERLGWSCASDRDSDLAVGVALERRSLDHHPSPVDGTLERVGYSRGVA